MNDITTELRIGLKTTVDEMLNDMDCSDSNYLLRLVFIKGVIEDFIIHFNKKVKEE